MPDPNGQLRFERLLSAGEHVHGELSALLKPEEVRLILNVSRSWLYEAANTGRIPSVRLGLSGSRRRLRRQRRLPGRALDGQLSECLARTGGGLREASKTPHSLLRRMGASEGGAQASRNGRALGEGVREHGLL